MPHPVQRRVVTGAGTRALKEGVRVASLQADPVPHLAPWKVPSYGVRVVWVSDRMKEGVPPQSGSGVGAQAPSTGSQPPPLGDRLPVTT